MADKRCTCFATEADDCACGAWDMADNELIERLDEMAAFCEGATERDRPSPSNVARLCRQAIQALSTTPDAVEREDYGYPFQNPLCDPHPVEPTSPTAEVDVERVARAMCDGKWDAASFCETPNGEEPEEQRDYWREKARAAIKALHPSVGVDDAG